MVMLCSDGGGVMIVLGFIGLIGMGKIVIVVMFVEVGLLVYDVDVVVYVFYEKGGVVVGLLFERFGNIIKDGVVDCVVLCIKVVDDLDVMVDLECIVYFFVGLS